MEKTTTHFEYWDRVVILVKFLKVSIKRDFNIIVLLWEGLYRKIERQ